MKLKGNRMLAIGRIIELIDMLPGFNSPIENAQFLGLDHFDNQRIAHLVITHFGWKLKL
jgi:hypothetical protein